MIKLIWGVKMSKKKKKKYKNLLSKVLVYFLLFLMIGSTIIGFFIM